MGHFSSVLQSAQIFHNIGLHLHYSDGMHKSGLGVTNTNTSIIPAIEHKMSKSVLVLFPLSKIGLV